MALRCSSTVVDWAGVAALSRWWAEDVSWDVFADPDGNECRVLSSREV